MCRGIIGMCRSEEKKFKKINKKMTLVDGFDYFLLSRPLRGSRIEFIPLLESSGL